jgi:hypothetical protein
MQNTINQNSSDEEIKNYMLETTNIAEWNSRREEVKLYKDEFWVASNIDSNGFVMKANFPENVTNNN